MYKYLSDVEVEDGCVLLCGCFERPTSVIHLVNLKSDADHHHYDAQSDLPNACHELNLRPRSAYFTHEAIKRCADISKSGVAIDVIFQPAD